MRADRLISLLILLQKRNGVTARELAKVLEVSERTIYRDLTALSSAGIPVYTRGGPGGGCFLVEEYRTNLTGMTSDMARALFALSIPSPLDQLGLSQDLKAALLRISAALPPGSQGAEEKDRQRLFLDWGSYDQHKTNPGCLQTIHQAIWQDCKVRILFRSFFSPWIDQIEEVVCPYSLVAWAGDWYAACQWGESVHIIRLDLVERVEKLAETFIRPDDFDLPAFWLAWREKMANDRPYYNVQARISPELVVHMTEWHPASVADNGWMTGEIIYPSFEAARAKVLSYGGAIEVLEPEAMRLSVMDFARQTLGAYSKDKYRSDESNLERT